MTELEDGGDGSEMKNKANSTARGHAIFSFLLFSLLRHSQLLFFFFFYARNRLARRQKKKKKKKATRSISFASFKLRIHKQGHAERTGQRRAERVVVATQRLCLLAVVLSCHILQDSSLLFVRFFF